MGNIDVDLDLPKVLDWGLCTLYASLLPVASGPFSGLCVVVTASLIVRCLGYALGKAKQYECYDILQVYSDTFTWVSRRSQRPHD
jgi:hypothetical protein